MATLELLAVAHCGCGNRAPMRVMAEVDKDGNVSNFKAPNAPENWVFTKRSGYGQGTETEFQCNRCWNHE